MAYRIVIDPGHGGSDWGASYEGRKEKDDNLNLALAVGRILQNNGVDIEYTRTDDVYNTPLEKAMMEIMPMRISLFLFTEMQRVCLKNQPG